MGKMKHLAVYMRVSTDKQSDTSQQYAIDKYLNELKDEDKPTSVTFFTETISGKTKVRPVFNKMIEACKEGKHDTILVWKIDRFSRSIGQIIRIILDLREIDIDFISITQPIFAITDPAFKTLVYSIYAYMADLESSLIRERTTNALKAAKFRGVKLGNRPLNNQLKQNVIDHLNAGHSVKEILTDVPVSKSTIMRIKRSLNK